MSFSASTIGSSIELQQFASLDGSKVNTTHGSQLGERSIFERANPLDLQSARLSVTQWSRLLSTMRRQLSITMALVQSFDKAWVIKSLQALVKGGHRFDVDEIATYAMATGWTGAEVMRLREYGEGVLQGRRFRLTGTSGPKPGACKVWERQCAERAQSD